MQFFDIILLAALAAFVLYRLGRVLGRRPGDDSGPVFRPPSSPGDDNVVSLPGRLLRGVQPKPRAVPRRKRAEDQGEDAANDEALGNAGIAEIRMQDASFDAAEFLAGAKAAYEQILTAFAAGDRDTLRRLLTGEVVENFSRAIAEREQRGETLQTTLVGIRSADISDARMAGRVAEVTVKFVAEVINVVTKKDATPADEPLGAPPVRQVIDVWKIGRAHV